MRGLVVAIAILTIHTTAQAACERPDDIAIPDGQTATEEEMRAADAEYRQFMDAMRAYQECLASESDQQRPRSANANANALSRHENAFVARHNAASDAMTRVTDAFTEAIEAYEARQ